VDWVERVTGSVKLSAVLDRGLCGMLALAVALAQPTFVMSSFGPLVEMMVVMECRLRRVTEEAPCLLQIARV
jgi:hypothetical protein